MKYFIIGFFYLSLLVSTNYCFLDYNENKNLQITFNDISVTYLDNHNLIFTTTLTIKNSGNIASNQLIISLSLFVKELAITINGASIPYKTKSNTYFNEIILEYTLDAEKSVDILFNYKISIEHNSTPLASENNIIYVLPESYSFPFLPGPFMISHSPYRLSVIIPNEYTAFTSGRLIKSQKENEYQKAIVFENKSNDAPFFVLGEFNIDSVKVQNTLLNIYVPKFMAKVKYNSVELFSIFNKIKEFYSNLWGEINNTKYSLLFISRRGGYAPRDALLINYDFIKDTLQCKKLLAHEIAHFWWANRVRFEDGFLGEALAQYSKELFYKKNMPKDYHLTYIQNPEFIHNGKYNYYKLSPWDSLYKTLAYIKAPLIIQLIENEIGINNFNRELRKICEIENNNISLDQFISIFKKYGSLEKKLIYYFSGNIEPDYKVSLNDHGIEITSTDNIFDTKLPIKILLKNNQSIIDTVLIPKGVSNYTMSFKDLSDIKFITLDPVGDLIQSDITNDTWSNFKSYRINSKMGKQYSLELNDFFDSLFSAINTPNFNDYKKFSNNLLTESQMKNYFSKLANMKFDFTVYDIDGKDIYKNFKIILRYDLSSNKTIYGFIDGSLVIKKDSIKVDNIYKVKI